MVDNKLLRDKIYMSNNAEAFIDKNSGSYIPAARGKAKFEVYRRGYFEQRYETMKAAKAFIADCVKEGYAPLHDFSIGRA